MLPTIVRDLHPLKLQVSPQHKSERCWTSDIPVCQRFYGRSLKSGNILSTPASIRFIAEVPPETRMPTPHWSCLPLLGRESGAEIRARVFPCWRWIPSRHSRAQERAVLYRMNMSFVPKTGQAGLASSASMPKHIAAVCCRRSASLILRGNHGCLRSQTIEDFSFWRGILA